MSLPFDLNDSDTSKDVGQAVVIVEGVEMSKSAATRDRNVKQYLASPILVCAILHNHINLQFFLAVVHIEYSE